MTSAAEPDALARSAALAARLGRKPAVGIISMSPIADDPRVRRQGDAFHAAGWNVQAFGLSGRVARAPEWPIGTPEDAAALSQEPAMPVTQYDIPRLRRLPVGLLKLAQRHQERRQNYQLAYELRLLEVYVDPGLAERIYWTLNGTFWDILALGRRFSADLWLANDWTALPIVARIAGEQGVPYVYDTHEFAAEEFNERRSWRYVQRPIRVETERKFIRQAAVVSTVSSGIAKRLQAIHGLGATPLTICSTPAYQEMPFHPTGGRIHVLYHGAVWEHRGLEECIRSVASWRPEFDFTIRGPVGDDYRARLEVEIDAAGVRGRVHIVPPVAMIDLVREAGAFDVGLFALPGHSAHNEYALPNKFFEYTMAGLALCISDLPEMTALIRKHGHGIVFSGMEPQAIAAAVNGLDRDAIDRFKQRSLAAARELCWERESASMLAAYLDVLEARG